MTGQSVGAGFMTESIVTAVGAAVDEAKEHTDTLTREPSTKGLKPRQVEYSEEHSALLASGEPRQVL